MRIASVAEVKTHFSAYVKESETGPVVITRNGKPAAVLVNVADEDQLEGLILAFSPRLRLILQAGREEIRQTGGIQHDKFWQGIDAEYTDAESSTLVTADEVS